MDGPCVHCGETVAPDDRFRSDKTRMVLHHACAVRMAAGSLGHQLGLCRCRGGPSLMEDPPGLTAREAARTAAAYYEKTFVEMCERLRKEVSGG